MPALQSFPHTSFGSQCQLNDKPKWRTAASASVETLLVIKYLTSNNTTKSLPAIWHNAEKYSGPAEQTTDGSLDDCRHVRM